MLPEFFLADTAFLRSLKHRCPSFPEELAPISPTSNAESLLSTLDNVLLQSVLNNSDTQTNHFETALAIIRSV